MTGSPSWSRKIDCLYVALPVKRDHLVSGILSCSRGESACYFWCFVVINATGGIPALVPVPHIHWSRYKHG